MQSIHLICLSCLVYNQALNFLGYTILDHTHHLHTFRKLLTSNVATGIPIGPHQSHNDHEHFNGHYHLPAVLNAHQKQSQGLSNYKGVDCIESQHLQHWQCKFQQLTHPMRNPYQDFTALHNQCHCHSPWQQWWMTPAPDSPISFHCKRA